MWIQQNFEKTADHLYTGSGHFVNYNNPHNVTAAQVGTYTSGVIDSLISNISITASGSRPTYANVKDYGAIGDGSTDDTNAIISAIDAVAPAVGNFSAYDWYSPAILGYPTSQGASVYFPKGIYKTTRPIPLRGFVNYIGDGQSSVIKAILPSGSVSGAFYTHLDGTSSCSQWSVKDIFIWTQYGHGIYAPSGGMSFVVENTTISAYGWGIYMSDATYCQSTRIEKVWMPQPGHGGVRLVGNLNSINKLDIGGSNVRPSFNSANVEGMVVIKGADFDCNQVHVEIGTGVKCFKIGGAGPTYPGYGTRNILFDSTWLENEGDASGIVWHLDSVENFTSRNTSYVSSGKMYIKNCANVAADFAYEDNVEFDVSDTSSFVFGGQRPSYFGFQGKGEGRVSIDSEYNYGLQSVRYTPISRYGNLIDRIYTLDGRGSNVVWDFQNITNIGPTWKAQWTTQPSGYFDLWFYGVNPASTSDVNNTAWFSAILDWDVWDSTNGAISTWFGFSSPIGAFGTKWRKKGPVLSKVPDSNDLTQPILLRFFGNSGTVYIKDPAIVIGGDFQPPPAPQKYFYSSDGPIFGFGTAAPTTGYWTRGSRIFNSAPSAGGVPGWVCVASGIPGTWKNEANISA